MGAWGCGWVSVAWLTSDMKKRAREMEAAAYSAPAPAPPRRAARRKSPRLAEQQTAGEAWREVAGDDGEEEPEEEELA